MAVSSPLASKRLASRRSGPIASSTNADIPVMPTVEPASPESATVETGTVETQESEHEEAKR